MNIYPHPKLVLETSIGKKALSPEVRKYISTVMRDLELLPEMTIQESRDVVAAFAMGKYRDDVLWHALSVLNFVASSCVIYQTQPYNLADMVVGVRNSKYPTAVQAFMYGVQPEQLSVITHTLKAVVATQLLNDHFAFAKSAILLAYKDSVKPILAAMLEVRFGGVSSEQKRLWNI